MVWQWCGNQPIHGNQRHTASWCYCWPLHSTGWQTALRYTSKKSSIYTHNFVNMSFVNIIKTVKKIKNINDKLYNKYQSHINVNVKNLQVLFFIYNLFCDRLWIFSHSADFKINLIYCAGFHNYAKKNWHQPSVTP